MSDTNVNPNDVPNNETVSAPAMRPESTPIYDKMGSNPKEDKLAFVEKAGKAVWAFICTFIAGAIIAIIPPLLAGHVPSNEEVMIGIGMGLAAAYGTGQTVYSVTNKTKR